MGLFRNLGKAVLKAATGIELPPSEGEVRYNEYKDAIDDIFVAFEKTDTSKGWKDVLAVVKETAIGTLHDNNVRKSIEATICTVEYARIYMNVISAFVGSDQIKSFADDRGQGPNYEFLGAMVNLALGVCALMDERVKQAGLTKEEEWIFRMCFDVFFTRQPFMMIVWFQEKGNDLAKTFEVCLDWMLVNERLYAAFERECAERNVDSNSIKRKFGK